MRKKTPASNLSGYAAQFTYSATTTLPTAVAGDLQSSESPYVPTFSDMMAQRREEEPATRNNYATTMDDGPSSTPSVDNSIPRSLSYKKFEAIESGASAMKAIEFIRSTIPTRTTLGQEPNFPACYQPYITESDIISAQSTVQVINYMGCSHGAEVVTPEMLIVDVFDRNYPLYLRIKLWEQLHGSHHLGELAKIHFDVTTRPWRTMHLS